LVRREFRTRHVFETLGLRKPCFDNQKWRTRSSRFLSRTRSSHRRTRESVSQVQPMDSKAVLNRYIVKAQNQST
jgi:hypothetical protein